MQDFGLESEDRFEDIINEISELHYRKSLDYGTEEDPYNNIRHSADWGLPPWMGAMIRANDKIHRIQRYAKASTLANESVRDSFLDLAVYAIIALILWEEEEEKIESKSVGPSEGNTFCP